MCKEIHQNYLNALKIKFKIVLIPMIFPGLDITFLKSPNGFPWLWEAFCLLKFIFKAFEIHPEDQRGLNRDEKLKDHFSWCSDSHETDHRQLWDFAEMCLWVLCYVSDSHFPHYHTRVCQTNPNLYTQDIKTHMRYLWYLNRFSKTTMRWNGEQMEFSCFSDF